MKPKTMILMVVAVVCGLAAMYMTNRLLADKAPPPPANTVKVLVSKQKINAWTPLKKPEDLFEEKEVPEGTYSTKCITDLKDLKDQALKSPLNEQMPVTKDDLLSKETAGLVGMLKNGERAVALRVTPESLAGGFVLPGSKVDVMFIKHRGDGDSEVQIFLQDMLVLAVDMKNTRDDGQTSMLGSTATLAATPEESEQLALAGSLGDLRLLLRTPLDTETPNYRKIGISSIGHQSRAKGAATPEDTDTTATNISATLPALPKVTDKTPPVATAEAPPAPPVTFKTRVISGDTKLNWTFVWDKEHNCWEGDPDKGESAKSEDAPKPADEAKPEEAPKSKDAPKPQPKAPAAKDAPVG